MYLTEDIIGPSSRITYGLKGDLVNVIRPHYNMTLVENKGQKFFVRNEKLSQEKVDPTPEALRESAKGIQRTHKRKR
jgi:hypothetical protein